MEAIKESPLNLHYILQSSEDFDENIEDAFSRRVTRLIAEKKLNFEKIHPKRLRKVLDELHNIITPECQSVVNRSTYCRDNQLAYYDTPEQKTANAEESEFKRAYLALQSNSLQNNAQLYQQHYFKYLDLLQLLSMALDFCSENSLRKKFLKTHNRAEFEQYLDNKILAAKGQEYLEKLSQGISVDHDKELHAKNYKRCIAFVLDYFTTQEYDSWRQSAVPATYMPVHPRDIDSAFESMVDEIEKRIKKKENIIDVAAWAHCTFISIHPYKTGNKRCARALMNLILLSNGLSAVTFSQSEVSHYLDCTFESLFCRLTPWNQHAIYDEHAFSELLRRKLNVGNATISRQNAGEL